MQFKRTNLQNPVWDCNFSGDCIIPVIVVVVLPTNDLHGHLIQCVELTIRSIFIWFYLPLVTRFHWLETISVLNRTFVFLPPEGKTPKTRYCLRNWDVGTHPSSPPILQSFCAQCFVCSQTMTFISLLFNLNRHKEVAWINMYTRELVLPWKPKKNLQPQWKQLFLEWASMLQAPLPTGPHI